MSASAPIAVVGMACRLSGDVNSPTELWNLVSQKGSTLTEIPRDRWNVDSFYHPNKDRKGTVRSIYHSLPCPDSVPDNVAQMHMRGGHFLKSDLACFDAPFFSITPSEAKAMDPQQRFLLEVTYEAIENGASDTCHAHKCPVFPRLTLLASFHPSRDTSRIFCGQQYFLLYWGFLFERLRSKSQPRHPT